jgi:hypothetical protein
LSAAGTIGAVALGFADFHHFEPNLSRAHGLSHKVLGGSSCYLAEHYSLRNKLEYAGVTSKQLNAFNDSVGFIQKDLLDIRMVKLSEFGKNRRK